MFDATPTTQPSPAPPPAGPRGRYWWSPFEKLLLREHYPKGGLAACRPLLPDRSDCSIHQQAGELGLRSPRRSAIQEHWTSTPHMDEAIRRAYAEDGRRGMLQRLGNKLRRPPRWIAHRARQLGIATPRLQEPPWSEHETDLILANAKKRPQSISLLLKRHGYRRTSSAIALRLRRLHADRTDDDHYTGDSLAVLMGVEGRKVRAWIDKGWLRAKQNRNVAGSPYRIHRKDVRRFIIENVGAVDIRRVDKHWFVDLVAGSD